MVRFEGLGIEVEILLGMDIAMEKIETKSPPEGKPLQKVNQY